VQSTEVRAERLEDISAIHKINGLAFGRENEADLVDRLRKVTHTFSFVAVKLNQIVGHIFYSPVEIEGEWTDDLLILGLAPVAVLPEYQRQGIGSLLIRYSLEECARLGCKAVVVLGNPMYYSRFGFVSAKEKGLKCEYVELGTAPEEAFMVLELDWIFAKKGGLKECKGMVKYRLEFGEFV
jgi:putative acetyltransferase